MKKLLNAIAIVLIGMIVLVSCSVETNKIEDELRVISFSVDEGNTRSLTKTNPVLNAEDFWWSYTSVKTDGTELVTGQTGADIANKKDIGTKGLTEKAGIFSYGGWKFTLYGYADSARTELAYKGSADVVINAKTTTLSVTVQSQTAGEGSGKLQIPAKGAITLKLNDSDTNPTSVENYTKLTEKVYIEGSEESNKNFTQTEYITNTEKPTDIPLASGSYKVTITYQSKEDPAEDDEDKTAPVIYAEDVIYVTIADYLTTKIGGDISENNGQVEFIAQGEIIKAKVEKTVVEGKDTVLEVKAAPVSAAADTTPRTTVSIPRGVLETGKSASLSVTSFSTTAIDDGDAKDAEFTVVDTADKGKPILGALDITLTVGIEEKKDFTNNPLTITTVIAKGLNGNKNYQTEGDNTACSIQVKYNGEGDGGTVTSYNAETGELTFTVTHLSTYYVVDDNIKVYNLTQDLMYGKLEDAVADAEDGDTIRLLKDISADFSTSTDADTAVIIDLNKKTLTLENTSLNTGNDFSLRNGTLAITVDTKELHVNSGTLTVEEISAEGVTLYGIVEEKTNSKIKVTPEPKKNDILTMGKTPSDFEIRPKTQYETEEKFENAVKGYRGIDLTWKVLDVQKGRALVISECILSYETHGSSITTQTKYKWSTSPINEWLNDTTENGFVAKYGLGSASMVSVDHETEAGKVEAETTNEKVFLLSSTEAKTYFSTDSDRVGRKLNKTAYSEGDAYMWWLRTPTTDNPPGFCCAYVDQNGKILSTSGGSYWYIRPAFWINIATSLD